MEYIHIKNLEKYQPKYKDGRRLLWIRWDIDALSDYKITKLTPEQKWLFLGLICLEVKAKREVPWDEKWLSEQLGFTKNHIHKHLLMLQTLELIVKVCYKDIESPYPTIHTDIHTIQTNNTLHFSFDDLWLKYPKRVGKKEAERHFRASVKTEKDYLDIQAALKNYLESERVAKGYVLNGSTFFNQWTDWVDFKEPLCPKCKGTGKFTSPTGYQGYCDCPTGVRAKAGGVRLNT